MGGYDADRHKRWAYSGGNPPFGGSELGLGRPPKDPDKPLGKPKRKLDLQVGLEPIDIPPWKGSLDKFRAEASVIRDALRKDRPVSKTSIAAFNLQEVSLRKRIAREDAGNAAREIAKQEIRDLVSELAPAIQAASPAPAAGPPARAPLQGR